METRSAKFCQNSNNGNITDLSQLYGDPPRITYSIKHKTFQLVIDGKTVTINYEEYIKEALTEWQTMINKIDPNAQISFVLSSLGSANFTFDIDASSTVGHFGIVRYSKSGDKIEFSSQATLNYLKDDLSTFTKNDIFPSSTTVLDAFYIFLKTTLKHEIGHALGLAHPTERCILTQQQNGTVIPRSLSDLT